MPLPEVIKVSTTQGALINESLPQGLTINWQWVLAKVSEALIARNSLGVLKLLFFELDYVQLHGNAIEDIRSLLRQPVDENVLREIETKLDSLKKLMGEYLKHPQNNVPLLNRLHSESSFVVQQLKSLDVVGVGAFMLASGFRLALLQLQAASDRTAWSQIKDKAIEDSNYAFKVTPKLFRLSIGRIDKSCQCIMWSSEPRQEESTTQYECRYFDGKDIHIFRASRAIAEFECNKHRLLMFSSVGERVNQTAALPVRTAVKKWQELAASVEKNHPTNDELVDQRMLVSGDSPTRFSEE